MAEIIRLDGSRETLTPENREVFSLKEMQGVVGGYIEFVCLPAQVMVVNEDGLSLGLLPNPEASSLAGRPIVGDVLVSSHRELGD